MLDTYIQEKVYLYMYMNSNLTKDNLIIKNDPYESALEVEVSNTKRFQEKIV